MRTNVTHSCETAIHVIRSFVTSQGNGRSIVPMNDSKMFFTALRFLSIIDIILAEATDRIVYAFLYQCFSPSNLFSEEHPISSRALIQSLIRRLREVSNDPRSGSGAFLVQSIFLAIQRGNAASVMGTF